MSAQKRNGVRKRVDVRAAVVTTELGGCDGVGSEDDAVVVAANELGARVQERVRVEEATLLASEVETADNGRVEVSVKVAGVRVKQDLRADVDIGVATKLNTGDVDVEVYAGVNDGEDAAVGELGLLRVSVRSTRCQGSEVLQTRMGDKSRTAKR